MTLTDPSKFPALKGVVVTHNISKYLDISQVTSPQLYLVQSNPNLSYTLVVIPGLPCRSQIMDGNSLLHYHQIYNTIMCGALIHCTHQYITLQCLLAQHMDTRVYIPRLYIPRSIATINLEPSKKIAFLRSVTKVVRKSEQSTIYMFNETFVNVVDIGFLKIPHRILEAGGSSMAIKLRICFYFLQTSDNS